MGEIQGSLWMQRLYYNVFTSYSTLFSFLHAMPEVFYCVCSVWLTHNCIVEIVTSGEEGLDIWLWNNWCFWLLENCWRLFTLIWWLLLGWWGGSHSLVISTLEGREFCYFLFSFCLFFSECNVNSESYKNIWQSASLESLLL